MDYIWTEIENGSYLQISEKLTTLVRSKLTTWERCKMTTLIRTELTTNCGG